MLPTSYHLACVWLVSNSNKTSFSGGWTNLLPGYSELKKIEHYSAKMLTDQVAAKLIWKGITGLCNVGLPTLFTVVINIEHLIQFNNIVQCCWHVWTKWAAKYCSMLLKRMLKVFSRVWTINACVICKAHQRLRSIPTNILISLISPVFELLGIFTL